MNKLVSSKGVGKRIQELRSKSNIKQEVFAKDLRVSKSCLSLYENEKREITFNTFIDILKVFKKYNQDEVILELLDDIKKDVLLEKDINLNERINEEMKKLNEKIKNLEVEINDIKYYAKMQSIPYGVWTPFGEVLCSDCCGFSLNNNSNNIDNDYDYELTTCNKCGKEIKMYYTIAHENNLCNELKSKGINSSMAQTGGMCSAISINRQDGGELLIVYDALEDSEWCICFYDKNGDWQENNDLTSNSKDEIIEYILNLKDLK